METTSPAKIESILVKCDTTAGMLTPGETVILADYVSYLEDQVNKLKSANYQLADEIRALDVDRPPRYFPCPT